jgi:hypothetical protein
LRVEAQRVSVNVATTPGRHGAYREYPHEFAEAVRPFLREASGAST